jgi:hypothetical protein
MAYNPIEDGRSTHGQNGVQTWILRSVGWYPGRGPVRSGMRPFRVVGCLVVSCVALYVPVLWLYAPLQGYGIFSIPSYLSRWGPDMVQIWGIWGPRFDGFQGSDPKMVGFEVLNMRYGAV